MRNINWLGITVAAICSAVSICFIIDYSLGSTESGWRAAISAAVGIAAVTWEVVGLHRASHLRRAGRYGAALLCMGGLLLSVLITVTYEIGSLAELLETKAAIGQSRAGERGALEAERAMLMKQVEKTGAARPVDAIKGDIDAIKAHPRWTSTGGCTNVTAEESKELCTGYGKLAAELGAASAIAGVHARITDLNGKLQPLAGNSVADARANYLSKLSGMPEIDARIGISLLVIAFLLFGRVVGGFVFMDARAETAEVKVETVAEVVQTSNAPESPTEARTAALSIPAPTTEAEAPFHGLPDLLDDEDEEIIGPSQEDIDAFFAQHEASQIVQAMNADRPAKAEPIEFDLSTLSEDQLHKRGIILQFSRDCLTLLGPDSNEFEGATVLWNAYEVWASDMEIRDITTQQAFGRAFNRMLKERGAERAAEGESEAERGRGKSSTVRYYGVKINPAHAHRMAFGAKVVSETGTNGHPRRLGSLLKDSLLVAADSPVEGRA